MVPFIFIYRKSGRRHLYYSLNYLHPKSPFLPRLVESTDVSSQAKNPSPSLHLRFLCYHTFVPRLKKQEPQPSKVKLLPIIYSRLTPLYYMLMITLSVEIRNPLNPKNYDASLSSIQFHQLTCTCGH